MLYTHMHTHVSIYMHVYTYIYRNVHMCISLIHICMYINSYECMHLPLGTF